MLSWSNVELDSVKPAQNLMNNSRKIDY